MGVHSSGAEDSSAEPLCDSSRIGAFGDAGARDYDGSDARGGGARDDVVEVGIDVVGQVGADVNEGRLQGRKQGNDK